MIEVLQALGGNGCDIAELVKSEVVTRTVIGRWLRQNKTFKMYWMDLNKSAGLTHLSDATSGLTKSMENIHKRIAGGNIKELVSAGKFFKSMIDGGEDPADSPVKATKKTEYDTEGRIMSVTEQIETVKKIRANRAINQDEDE